MSGTCSLRRSQWTGADCGAAVVDKEASTQRGAWERHPGALGSPDRPGSIRVASPGKRGKSCSRQSSGFRNQRVVGAKTRSGPQRMPERAAVGSVRSPEVKFHYCFPQIVGEFASLACLTSLSMSLHPICNLRTEHPFTGDAACSSNGRLHSMNLFLCVCVCASLTCLLCLPPVRSLQAGIFVFLLSLPPLPPSGYSCFSRRSAPAY